MKFDSEDQREVPLEIWHGYLRKYYDKYKVFQKSSEPGYEGDYSWRIKCLPRDADRDIELTRLYDQQNPEINLLTYMAICDSKRELSALKARLLPYQEKGFLEIEDVDFDLMATFKESDLHRLEEVLRIYKRQKNKKNREIRPPKQ